MHTPPKSRQEHHTCQDDAVVVHRRNRGRERIWEAEHDVEENYEQCSDNVYEEAEFAHPERAMRDIAAAGQDVRDEAAGVGRRAEDDERPRKIGEGGFAAARDGSKCGGHETREESGWDGTAELLVYTREETRERSRIITGKCPPRSTNLFGSKC